MAKEDKNDLFERVKNESTTANGSKDKGIINRETAQSISLKENGDINLISGKYSQVKSNSENGNITIASLQTNIISPQLDIMSSDISINKHKLNSQLHELTNFKKVNNSVIGGMTINGYVYVKAWEPTLEKYVLIRRNISTPMFSNLLDPFKLNDNLNIEVKISDDILNYKIQKDGE